MPARVRDVRSMLSWRRMLFIVSAVVLSVVSVHAPGEGAARESAPAGAARPGSFRSSDRLTARAGAPRTMDSRRGAYDELISLMSAEEGVDPDLVRAIINVESKFDPSAVSRKGAKGLMQLMPETASRYAVRDPFHPEANIRGGVRYLRFLQDMFPGRLPWVLAAYNAGENAVLRHNGIPPFRETQEYVNRVLARYGRPDLYAGPPDARFVRDAGAFEEPQAPSPTPGVFRVVDSDVSVSYTNIRPPKTR